MDGFDLADGIDVLRRTPAVLDALLRDLPDAWLASDEGPGTWTAVDVVRHLLHGEHVDWIPRTRHLLAHGTRVPWEPFDPAGAATVVGASPAHELLDRLATVRAENVAVLDGLDLTPDDLDRRALHPSFGEVTLRQHLATWVTHDLDHTRQALTAMAQRHRDAVGPWTAYLTIVGSHTA